MNNKKQLVILFTLLTAVAISAFSYFSNSENEVVVSVEEIPTETVKPLENTSTTQLIEKFPFPDESLQDFINQIYTKNITNCKTKIEFTYSEPECLKDTYEANLLIIKEKNTYEELAQEANSFLVQNTKDLSKNNINKLLEIIKYKEIIQNLEQETRLITALYEERFASSIKRTAIFANSDELLQAQVISYNFLKSGCIDRGLVSSEDAWLYPEEIQVRDENLINFALKIEPSIPIGPDCMGKLITSILNDPRGWNNITEKEFLLVSEEDADFTFIFSSPDKTDELCAPLETNGIYSCRNEEEIIINYFRWENGAIDFGNDMKTYRLYLINHETGHILGWGHTGCPKDGALAPVMMQQSKTTDGCTPYGWPLYEIIDMKYGFDTFVSLEED
ncbi:MAG: DUF3152 domain-containing protein [Actinobacteria bacterium]|jgi:hypothetical protein|nr:DUF3152 domain-containing protein [Actinomycetota bacterium]MBT7014211.1 DUF3152 domain-containing protein [Actinomycetota bacterium]MDA9603715.1 DUF3152 domain-containing protein [Candidatus Actinomarina sp.]|tara:strand:+ start:1209 stop:2381 length:1173 start_codon:yes stop_codon:yes gene_type:complete